MKKVTLVSLILIISAANLMADEFIFTYFDNYPPLSWKEDNLVKGIFIDIMDEIIEKRMGLKINHLAYPWKRAQLMVRNNYADGFITVPTKERLEYTKTNNIPVHIVEFTIFVNKDNKRLDTISKIKKLENLSDYNIVHYLGSGWAKSVLGDYNIHWTKNLDDSLKLLYLNRVDIFIDPRDITLYNIKQKNYTDRIIEVKQVLDEKKFMLCVGFKSKFNNYIDEFDFHLNEIKNDGTIEKILLKYR